MTLCQRSGHSPSRASFYVAITLIATGETFPVDTKSRPPYPHVGLEQQAQMGRFGRQAPIAWNCGENDKEENRTSRWRTRQGLTVFEFSADKPSRDCRWQRKAFQRP